MAKYFNYYPKVPYFVDQNTNSVELVTNILSKFSFASAFKDNTVVYYEYEIQDGDTPEILASKLYNSPERHWIILALNDIINVTTEWPLDATELNLYINAKYSENANTILNETGLSWARENTHSYYKIVTQTNDETLEKFTDRIEVDANTYANVIVSTSNYTLQEGKTITIDTTKEFKTYYEYEVENNDAKRTIKILKPDFVTAVEDEFRRVING